MKPLLLLTAAALALAIQPALAAFAQVGTNDNATLTGAAETPLRDLNIVKDKAPPVLQDAAAAPYAHVAPLDCKAMRAQIADLDKVLGPDLDEANYDPNNGSLLADAVHSAVSLPLGSVVRRLTGAQKAKEERDHALLAGYTRRAYLKGALASCEQVKPALAAANQARDTPDLAAQPPSDALPLSAHDTRVDASSRGIDVTDLPDSIPSSDAPAVRPLPGG